MCQLINLETKSPEILRGPLRCQRGHRLLTAPVTHEEDGVLARVGHDRRRGPGVESTEQSLPRQRRPENRGHLIAVEFKSWTAYLAQSFDDNALLDWP